ncbi:MAG: 30S ribosome-binding factor RbfA [Pseudomonadota bacterium]
MPETFSRQARLGGQIQRVLNELLRFESKDPRLDGVSVTTVDLSRDLSVARVYVSTLDPAADPAPVMDGLQRAGGFLRGRLGKEINVRHVPELRFQHDDSAARAEHLSQLMASASADQASRDGQDEDGED